MLIKFGEGEHKLVVEACTKGSCFNQRDPGDLIK